MSEEQPDVVVAYVRALADLTGMPLGPERAANVAAVMGRIAGFAADLGALDLSDDIEVAGVFTP